MQKILFLNPKGGCGKSTLSTTLASYYANWNLKVGIADFDPQKSSLTWLRNRTFDLPEITAINTNTTPIKFSEDLEFLIIDTPASIEVDKMLEIIKLTDTIIIPVLPSPIDIQAAGVFIYQLLLKHRITSEDKNICLIANRARNNSLMYKNLIKFTSSIKLPLITTIRDSRNYLHYASKGAGIFDHQTLRTQRDIQDWLPLTDWLNSKENPSL